ncbi:hypothetical protein SMD22_01630 (plasmid) [Brevibacillus halotolerans]|nr:hypothetical protein SMD22_01630 [Brevibacillus halotolerans]
MIFDWLFKRKHDDSFKREMKRIKYMIIEEMHLEEGEVDPTWYSVLIQFTPQGSIVYILEEDCFIVEDGSVIVGENIKTPMTISGSCVFQNELDNYQEVEEFILQFPRPDFQIELSGEGD